MNHNTSGLVVDQWPWLMVSHSVVRNQKPLEWRPSSLSPDDMKVGIRVNQVSQYSRMQNLGLAWINESLVGL